MLQFRFVFSFLNLFHWDEKITKCAIDREEKQDENMFFFLDSIRVHCLDRFHLNKEKIKCEMLDETRNKFPCFFSFRFHSIFYWLHYFLTPPLMVRIRSAFLTSIFWRFNFVAKYQRKVTGVSTRIKKRYVYTKLIQRKMRHIDQENGRSQRRKWKKGIERWS